ncbi:MAG: T9SS type A sorting domain-containing protein [Bacteroidota bacterium]
MKKLFLLIIAPFALLAQHEADNWYFGYNAGISFSSGSPVALMNGALTSDEGCSSISDSAGNLLFYTNGEKVWDRNHQLMPNGTGLYGQNSSTQSCLIVKRPGWTGRYFIFTTDIFFAFLPDNGFCYSEVDMSLNGGFGDIISTSKNINLIPDSVTEKLCGVRSANGIDVWVLVHTLNTNSFFAYLVTPSGVAISPIISNVGTFIGVFGHGGQMKFSLSGNRLALANDTNSFELLDFDDLTGIVSNPLVLTDSDYHLAYGVEFSPDDSRLYVSNFDVLNDSIYQYNLFAGSDSLIIASKLSLGSINAPNYIGQLQLAPDGKIYIVKSLSKLSIINNPNNLGLSCNLVINGVTIISPGENTDGLPNFVSSYLVSTGINEIKDENEFAIFYNAISNSLTYSFTKGKSGSLSLELFDITGRSVLHKELVYENNSGMITLPKLNQGIYFANVFNKEFNFTKKIIITK